MKDVRKAILSLQNAIRNNEYEGSQENALRILDELISIEVKPIPKPAHDDTTAPCMQVGCKKNRYRLGVCKKHYNMMPVKMY